jgi:hypothetical protein
MRCDLNQVQGTNPKGYGAKPQNTLAREIIRTPTAVTLVFPAGCTNLEISKAEIFLPSMVVLKRNEQLLSSREDVKEFHDLQSKLLSTVSLTNYTPDASKKNKLECISTG